ncbi:MAG: class I SAM-dependent methyltransferase [Ruminococcaceae bacterium]|nr:class I SAM-dependent methyltransferase [Oscillospiraceae bacterium]
MEKQYGSVAEFYDALNADFDYQAYASYIVGQIRANEKINSSLVLDLACGTGKMTFLLREHGYDMTGVDISEEMLGVARDICYDKGIDDVLLLCQGMQNFELYGTVDACVCCLDSLNYLTKIDDLKKCLSLVHNYLIPDGVFVFDINTPYRFENVYAQNAYILECEDALLAWQNDYNKKSKLCRFYLSLFEENENGSYTRYDEVQTERCYSKKQILDALSEAGFEIISIHGDFDGSDATDTDEKWFITARNIKE